MANTKSIFTSPAALLRLRLASLNARHLVAQAGVKRIRAEGLTKDNVNTRVAAAATPRGFYSWLLGYGRQSIASAVEELDKVGEVGQEFLQELRRTETADALFGGFGTVSAHSVLDLRVKVYPGLQTLAELERIYPEAGTKTDAVRSLLEQNMKTPPGEESPVILPEDHPGWASERPDIRNIRGDMAVAVSEAKENADEIARLVNKKYGPGTMDRIENIVVCGIGANDEYMKDLSMLVNADSTRRRNLYSIFEPRQLDSLPENVTAENTLFIAISRSGGTEETVDCLHFARKQGKLKYLVGYANKGRLREFTERENGITQDLNPNIGGRYMWAKGLIVLVPFALAASEQAWAEYTGAMVEFDNQFWPVGEDETVFNLAKHMYLYSRAYNTSGLFACSNHPVLEAGLREIFQNHNEAVGKVVNSMFAFGAGMEMLPFAHAGADGLLGAAVSAQHYGMFLFDTSYRFDLTRNIQLTADDLLGSEKDHAGLTQQLLAMACVFPNQAKFSYAGGPNQMWEFPGVTYRTLATKTALGQNIMYPYLIMNGTNPDSNPNVAMVRASTTQLVAALVGRGEASPLEVIAREIPRVMV